jgi:hypothetical protein
MIQQTTAARSPVGRLAVRNFEPNAFDERANRRATGAFPALAATLPTPALRDPKVQCISGIESAAPDL